MFVSDLLNRTILAVGIILIGASVWLIYNSILRHRLLPHRLLAGLAPIRPLAFILVYFTTPNSILCKTLQRPAIQKLNQLLGNALHVVEIDVAEHSELAIRWGVLSVPTTFLINPRGELLHVNHGFVCAEQLLLQIYGGK